MGPEEAHTPPGSEVALSPRPRAAPRAHPSCRPAGRARRASASPSSDAEREACCGRARHVVG